MAMLGKSVNLCNESQEGARLLLSLDGCIEVDRWFLSVLHQSDDRNIYYVEAFPLAARTQLRGDDLVFPLHVLGSLNANSKYG